MAEQLTPEAARDALAAADRMSRTGGRRGVWPRWAIIVEALFLAAGMIATSLMLSHFNVATVVLAGVILIASGRFRFWRIARSGGLAKPTWVDMAAMLLFLIVYLFGVLAPRFLGLDWAPWAMAPVILAMRVLRYEIGQRPLAAQSTTGRTA